MAKRSAGILLFRRRETLEVLLAHPGGPFWARKDDGAWSIPKGEFDPDEDPETAARREFLEETGMPLSVPLLPLGDIRQRGGKTVIAFAAEGEFDCAGLKSNLFEMEWRRGSGRLFAFPEVDRVDWFDPATARRKILPSQAVFLDRLAGAVEPA